MTFLIVIIKKGVSPLFLCLLGAKMGLKWDMTPFLPPNLRFEWEIILNLSIKKHQKGLPMYSMG
jgi:hypothetical protein